MERKHHSNVDGFVLRRRQSSGGQRPRITLDNPHPLDSKVPDKFLIDPTRTEPVNKPAQGSGPPLLARTALSGQATRLTAGGHEAAMSLTLDDLDDQPGKSDKQPRKKRFSWRHLPVKKIAKWSSVVAVLAILVIVGYFGYKFIEAGSKIFKGNPIAAIFSQAKPLKTDAHGQTNIILFGTSEDDPHHPGADLTDSIMIASINQQRKDGFLVSLPRDFYVNYGRACPAGYRGKVNTLYSCVKDKQGEEAGALALAKKAGQIFGLDIQYFVHVNYTVLRESVDAVGGITVDIDSSDRRGILDRNFDWDCPNGPQTCYNVKYPNGPVKLNGKQALYLARARGDDPLGRTYGLSRSNPDRQDNQRKILLALKDKAVSAGVLTNPVAVNKLLDTLGKNLRTNFDAEEVKTLIDLGKTIDSKNLASVALEDMRHPLATVSCFGGNVCPNAGAYNYTDIHATILAYVKNDTASIENARIDVLNASGKPGLAQKKALELSEADLNVGRVGNAPSKYASTPIRFYDLSKGKNPGTLHKLETLLGVSVTPGVPSGVSSNADFVVIMGKQTTSQ